MACSYGVALVLGLVLLPRFGPLALAMGPPVALAAACVWTWKSAVLLEQVHQPSTAAPRQLHSELFRV